MYSVELKDSHKTEETKYKKGVPDYEESSINGGLINAIEVTSTKNPLVNKVPVQKMPARVLKDHAPISKVVPEMMLIDHVPKSIIPTAIPAPMPPKIPLVTLP